MAFTIDFNTGNASNKVNTLQHGIDGIATSANRASLRLESAFKTPKEMQKLHSDLNKVKKLLGEISGISSTLNQKSLKGFSDTLKKQASSLRQVATATKMANAAGAKQATQLDVIATKANRAAARLSAALDSPKNSSKLISDLVKIDKLLVQIRASSDALGRSKGMERFSQQMHRQAEALRKFSAAQRQANGVGVKQIALNNLAGTKTGSGRMDVTHLAVMKSIADKQKAILEGRRRLHGANGKLAGSTGGLTGKILEMKKSMNASEKESAALRASMNALGTHMGIFTGKTIAVATAVYTTISAIQSLVVTGSDFSREMIRASAVMGASQLEYIQLEDKVRDLAKTTVFTATQVAEGLTFLGMAGLNSQEAILALEPTLNIAKIGFISFSEAADITTNVLRAFQMNASDLSQVADDLAVSITSSNATIQQLAKSLSYVAPIAFAARGSLKEVNAILSVMHDVGIKSSRAGVALRRAYANFLAPTNKVQSALARLNIVTKDGNGKLRSMIHILREVAAKGATAGDMVELFGVRAAPAMQAVIEDLRSLDPKMAKMVEALNNSEGAAKELGEAFEEYLGADARKLVSALQEKFIEIFKVNEKGFRDIVKQITEFIQAIDAKKIGEFVSSLVDITKWLIEMSGALAAILGIIIGKQLFTVLVTVGLSVASAFARVYDVVKKVSKGLAGLRVAMAGLGVAASAPLLGFGALVAVPALLWAAAEAYDAIVDKTNEEEEAQKAVNEQLRKRAELQQKIKEEQAVIEEARKSPFSDRTQNYLDKSGIKYDVPDQLQTMAESRHNKNMADLKAIKAELEGTIRASTLAINNTEMLGHSSEKAIKSMDAHIALIQKSLAGLRQVAKDTSKAQYVLADAFDNGVLQEDIDGRRKWAADAKKIFTEKNYELEETKVNEWADARIAQVERLVDFKAVSEEAALKTMRSVESSRFGQLDKNLSEQLAEATKKRNELMDMYGIQDAGNIPNLPNPSYVDGQPIPDIKSQGDLGALKEYHQEVQDLETSLSSLRREASETQKELRHAFVTDLIKEAGFDDSVDKIQKYNDGIKNQIEVVKKQTEAMKVSGKVSEATLTKSELTKQVEYEKLIALQENTYERIKNTDANSAALPIMAKSLSALKDEKKQLDANLIALEKARKEKQKEKEWQEYRTKLRSLSYVPDSVKTIENYDENKQMVKDYFIYEQNMKESALEEHAAYREAMAALDREYYEAQNPLMAQFWDSLATNTAQAITGVLTYQSTWEEAAISIRNAVFSSIIGSLVEVGIRKAQDWLYTQFINKAEMAQETAKTTQKVTNNTLEAASEVKKIGVVKAAQTAAGTEAASVVQGMAAMGIEVASAWSAAAVNVSAATLGTNIAPAMAALSGFHAANASMSAAGAAVGAAGLVAGRANGGHVDAGTPYLVGEREPELFIPDRAGTIINRNQARDKNSPFTQGGDGSQDSQRPQDIKIVNAIDPAFIEDYLAGTEGEQIIMNVISRNRGSL